MPITLRLSRVLQERKEKCGSYEKLSAEILAANHGRLTVEWRKLQRVIDGEGFRLSVDDLEALDTYLAPFGESLALRPLVEREGILDVLAAASKVSVLLGFRQERNAMSAWDVRSFAALQRGIQKTRPSTDIDIEVFPAAPEGIERVRGFPLDKLSAACSVGSPRGCLMAEMMLTKMFGLGDQAFQSPTIFDPHQLPFYFIWPPSKDGCESRFAGQAEQLRDRKIRKAVLDGKAYAFVFNGRPYCVPWGSNKDYGVICAQRRGKNGNQIALAIAGLSGPGTFAAARLLESGKVTLSVPENEVGRNGPTLYVAVEAEVEHQGKNDDRRVVHEDLLGEPGEWPAALDA